MKLNDLKINDEGIISEVVCNDNIKRRLMDLGFNKGVRVKSLYDNKSMRAYLIKGAVIGVRVEDSKDIEVNV